MAGIILACFSTSGYSPTFYPIHGIDWPSVLKSSRARVRGLLLPTSTVFLLWIRPPEWCWLADLGWLLFLVDKGWVQDSGLLTVHHWCLELSPLFGSMSWLSPACVLTIRLPPVYNTLEQWGRQHFLPTGGFPHLHLVRVVTPHPPQAFHCMSGSAPEVAMPVFSLATITLPTGFYNQCLLLPFITAVMSWAIESVLSRARWGPCNGTSFLTSSMYLQASYHFSSANWFQRVEVRGAVNTERDHILWM